MQNLRWLIAWETLGNGAARIATGVSEGEAPIALCQAISDQKIACPLL
jgi:hypothetical protein